MCRHCCDTALVGFLPLGDGTLWYRAAEKARTWEEFVLLLE